MDIKTFILVFIITNVFIFLFLLFYQTTSIKKNGLLKYYAAGKILMSIAWLLLSLRNSIPNFYSVAIGNIVLAIGIIFEVYSLALFSEKKQTHISRFFVGAGMVFMVSFMLIYNKADHIRVFVASFIDGSIFILGVLWLLFRKSKSKINYLVIILYAYLGIVLLIRAITAIYFDTSITLTSTGIIQNLSYISFLLVTFLGTFLLLLLLKENDDEEILRRTTQIKKANKLLELSNATKDRLFSIIAHDLKGPVSSFAQLSEILHKQKNDFSPDEKDILIEQLYNNSSKTFELLENLLSWARGQLDEIKISPKPFEINHLINQIVHQVHPIAQAKKQNIINNVPKNWQVNADYEMIQVVFRNIVSNAVKFSPVESEIRIEASHDKDNYIIHVIDNGVGIESRVLEKLLDPNFYHTTQGTQKETGSGLGLKLSKDFVEKNGGKLSIQSQENQGSIMSISLPAANE